MDETCAQDTVACIWSVTFLGFSHTMCLQFCSTPHWKVMHNMQALYRFHSSNPHLLITYRPNAIPTSVVANSESFQMYQFHTNREKVQKYRKQFQKTDSSLDRKITCKTYGNWGKTAWNCCKICDISKENLWPKLHSIQMSASSAMNATKLLHWHQNKTYVVHKPYNRLWSKNYYFKSRINKPP